MMQKVGCDSDQLVFNKIKSLSWNDLLFFSLVSVFATVPLGPALKNVSLVLLMFFWLASGVFWTERYRWLRQDWFLPLLCMVLLPWVGLLWSTDIQTGLGYAQRSVYWLYGLAAASILYQKYTAKNLILAFLAGLFVAAQVSVLQMMGFISMYQGTMYGFLNHISYSLLLVAGLLFLAYQFREQTNRSIRFGIVAGILLLMLNLGIGASRAGYLAFVFAVPWMLVVMFPRRQLVLIFFCGLLAVGALAMSPVVHTRVAEMKSNIVSYHQGEGLTSIGLRFHMWDGALKIWKAHPWLGVGTGGYRQAFSAVAEDPRYVIFSHPHNSLLHIAVSYGIVGVSVFIWLVVVVLRRGWMARRTPAGQIILVFLFVIGVGSLTDTQIMGHATGVLLGIISGLPANPTEMDDQAR